MRIRIGAASVEMIEADDRVCARIASGKTFEPRTLEIWADLCATRGGTVLDIGAYTGLFSISAAMLGCEVIAFEPMPQNAARCRENVRLNRMSVRLYEMALSDRIGSASIGYNPRVKLTSGASLLRRTLAQLDVPVGTVDAFDLPGVSAIKIDVERGEPEVLRGASETIERCKPAVLVEVLDAERKAAVRSALPGYRVAEEIDQRNWLMLPC